MSTRSEIARIDTDGTVKAMYCHFDGYFSGVGADLINLCNSQDLVDKLFSDINVADGIDDVENGLKNTANFTEDLGVPIYPNVDAFLEHFKDNVCIEYLYIWIPNEVAEEKIKNLLSKLRWENGFNYEMLKHSEGTWVCCDNYVQNDFYFANNASKVESFIRALKLNKKIGEVSEKNRKELFKYWYANCEDESIFFDDKTNTILAKDQLYWAKV